MMNKKIFVTAPMTPALEQRARVAAALVGVSRAEFVRRAVIDYLERIMQAQTSANRGVTNEPAK